jgi:hypothetical protein
MTGHLANLPLHIFDHTGELPLNEVDLHVTDRARLCLLLLHLLLQVFPQLSHLCLEVVTLISYLRLQSKVELRLSQICGDAFQFSSHVILGLLDDSLDIVLVLAKFL